MRLLQFLSAITESEFLIERDILNAKELKDWVKQSSERVQHPAAKTWFASQLFKYLVNRYEEGAHPLLDVPEGAPEWLVAKLQAGEPVLNITPTDKLATEKEGVIDWLNATFAEDAKAQIRSTWEDAVEAQKEWHSEIKRASKVTKLTPEQMEGLVNIKEYDTGFEWVDVQTEVCLKHEGTMMGHCVGQGGYTQGVKEGTTKIISLRDAKGLAHATIEGQSDSPINISRNFDPNQLNLFDQGAKELVGMTVQQIKGKENKGVPSKYRKYLLDFLTTFGVEKFTDYGLTDLENSGLFKLREGGYGDVDTIGEKMVTTPDGTPWMRVSGDDAVLKDYKGDINAKWFLQDKGGRGMGAAEEKTQGYINRLDFGWGARNKLSEYKDHVIALFSTYVKPTDRDLVSVGNNFTNQLNLNNYGLAVGRDDSVNIPSKVGDKQSTSEFGDVYTTKEQGTAFWLTSGDTIVSHFKVNDGTLVFSAQFGLPRGNMHNFVQQVVKWSGMGINQIQVGSKTIPVAEIKGEPKGEKVWENDGVTYWEEKSDLGTKSRYRAYDTHGNVLFIMSPSEIDVSGQGGHFHNMMVKNGGVAGYHAIYLLEHLDLDVGSYRQYNHFARAILDETNWFVSEYDDGWYYMDDNYPIVFKRVEYDEEGEHEDANDDATMDTFWSETGLDGAGPEQDFFANYVDELYHNNTIHWEDENEDDDGNYIKTDYYGDNNGDVDTVTHPVSGGSMRITP